jgi:hypothetical protein
MTLRFAVVHEARADFQIATELADRVLCESIDWLDTDIIVHQRIWTEFTRLGARLAWTQIPQLALEAGITPMGHFNGEPGLPDAAAARRAILFLRNEFPDVKAVLLIRDQDDQPDRRGGLEQARGQDHGDLSIVVGLAVVEREAWVISGFDPQDAEETARLDAERQTLGFDPRVRSHELTACKDDTATRSPKRVLRQLSGNDRSRERQCWTNTPLEQLRQRGGANGLAAYLGEVRDRLGPLIGHVAEG